MAASSPRVKVKFDGTKPCITARFSSFEELQNEVWITLGAVQERPKLQFSFVDGDGDDAIVRTYEQLKDATAYNKDDNLVLKCVVNRGGLPAALSSPGSQQQLRALLDNYVLNGPLYSSSGLSSVRTGTYTRSNKPVAVKVYSSPAMCDREYSALRYLGSWGNGSVPVVNLVGECRTRTNTGKDALIMERGSDDNLAGILRKLTAAAASAAVSNTRRTLFAEDVVRAVCQLHRAGIVWGDMKPENFVCFGSDAVSMRLKMVDFDSCAAWREVEGAEGVPRAFGSGDAVTVPYLAPERAACIVANVACPARRAQDLWSLGMLLYRVFVGEDALPVRSEQEGKRQVQRLAAAGEHARSGGTGEAAAAAAAAAAGALERELHQQLEGRLRHNASARHVVAALLRVRPEQRESCDNVMKRGLFSGQASVRGSVLAAQLSGVSAQLEDVAEAAEQRGEDLEEGQRQLLAQIAQESNAAEARAHGLKSGLENVAALVSDVAEAVEECADDQAEAQEQVLAVLERQREAAENNARTLSASVEGVAAAVQAMDSSVGGVAGAVQALGLRLDDIVIGLGKPGDGQGNSDGDGDGCGDGDSAPSVSGKAAAVAALRATACGSRQWTRFVDKLDRQWGSQNSLNLSGDIGADGAIAIAAALKAGAFSNLKSLTLRSCNIGSVGAVAIAAALEAGAYSNLISLTLRSCNIGSDGAIAIAAALKARVCPNLLLLTLPGNNIGAEGAAAIADALKAGACQNLKTLEMHENTFGASGAADIAAALKAGACPALTALNLSASNIGPTGVASIAAALKAAACPSLMALNLRVSNMGAVGAEAIAAALQAKACPVLSTLNLSDNIGADGVRSVAAALANGACPRLGILLLRDCLMGAGGAADLAAALTAEAYSKVTMLHLSGNNMGADGAAAIANALKAGACRNLKTLEIVANNIDADTAAAIVAFLKEVRPALTTQVTEEEQRPPRRSSLSPTRQQRKRQPSLHN